ncbi:AAA+ ATPase [Pelomyxa schiedti]|nr:AAA+ ATPase [Pelomyxa schiedti]
MTYYFRLPSRDFIEQQSRVPSENPLRATQAKTPWTRDQFQDSLLKFINSNFNNAPEYLNMWDDYLNKGVLNSLCNNTHLPPGIAKTNAFMENLFCTVVCLDAKIPLVIVGPPGCSKTLSFKVAVDNMKGQTSPKEFYRALHHVLPFRYQCSEQSTDTEIKSVYESAIQRQGTFPPNSRERCAVLLDEVGLPNEEKSPLKILHFKLDHPKVSSVLLSNRILDEAKTNRTLMLLQSEPPLTDLQTLAEGCIYGNETSGIAWATREILGALCTAYQAEVNRFYGSPYPARFFHLRDFVYFLRYLGKHCSEGNRAGDAFHISQDVVLAGLRRNFGGLVQSDFDKLVANFFYNINEALKKYGQPLWTEPATEQRRTEIASIKESLAERLTDADDPNTAPFRYIMLLDPTENEVAVSLLFDLGLCDRNQTSVCYIGDFRDDSDQRVKAAVVEKVKVAMEKGETIVLVNSASIHSSFYDVFNRHYTIMPKNKQDMAKDPTNSSTRLCYANLAAGSFSQPCLVHDNFRVIVHVPKSSLQTIPTPLLNRFEKYCLGIDDALFERLQMIPLTKLISPTSRVPLHPYEVLCNGAQNMVHELHTTAANSRLFYGVTPKETVSSLVLTVLERTLEMSKLRAQEEDPNSLVPLFPPLLGTQPETLELFGARDHWEQNMREYMISANLHLLQLAKPESIYFCKQLPVRYKHNYLLEQEHFSFYRFLGYLCQAHFSFAPHAPSKFLGATGDQTGEGIELTGTTVVVPQRGEYASKWCVFTRTSAEIIKLPTDKKLQRKMFDVLVQTGSVPQGAEQNPEDWMEVLSLGEMSSSQQCSSRVHDFCCSPKKLLLLCVADLSVATPNQINFLRNEINERWKVMEEQQQREQHLHRVAVLLLHFSPEIGLRAGSAYQAIFLKGWDFLYVDALGVVAGSSGANPHTEVDPRPWLARAFGLNLRDSESDRMKRDSSTQEVDTFRGFFFELLQQFCKFMTGSGLNTTTSTLDNEQAKDFYGKPNNVDTHGSPQNLIAAKSEERFQILKQLFEENPVLYEGILEQFSRSWTSGFLNKLVCEASTELFRGSCVVSFVTAISSSLHNFMAPLVSSMLQMMLSSFGLNSVLNMFNNRHKGKLLELVHRVYCTIPIPQLGKSVLTNSKQLNSTPTVTVLRTHPFPPELPFYDAIAHLVNTQVIRAARELRHQKASPQILHGKVLESIKSNKLLAELLESITNQPLFDMFKRDFVTRSLKLSTLHISEFRKLLGSTNTDDLEGRLGRFMEMILSSLRAFKIGLVEDIPELFVIKRFYEPEISYFKALVTPLQLLNPALTPEQFDRCRRPPRFEKNQLQEMEKWVTTLTTDLLWERLTKEILTGGPKLDSNATVNWGQVYHHFFSTLKSRPELATLLSNSPDAILKLDAMHVVFVFLSNYRAPGLKPTFSFLTQNPGLPQILGQFVSTPYTPSTRLKAGLLLALNLLPPDPSRSTGEDIQSMCSVVDYMLQESEKSMLSDDAKANFSSFLQICNDSHEDFVSNPVWRVYCKKITENIGWVANFLFSWLEPKPSAWISEILQLTSDLIADTKPSFSAETYQYSPDLLSPTQIPTTHLPLEFLLYHILLKFMCPSRGDQSCKTLEIKTLEDAYKILTSFPREGEHVLLQVKKAASRTTLLGLLASTLSGPIGLSAQLRKIKPEIVQAVSQLLSPGSTLAVNARDFFLGQITSEEIFTALLQDHEALQLLSLEDIKPGTKNVTTRRTEAMALLPSCIIGGGEFYDLIQSQSKKLSSTGLLATFLQKAPVLRVFSHLPTLVHFYQLLNSVFAPLMKEDRIVGTFSDCVEWVGCNSPANKESISSAYLKFLDAWKAIVTGFNDVKLNIKIPEIGPETPFFELVSWKDVTKGDLLFTVIRTMTEIQNSLIQLRNESDTDEINPFGFIFEQSSHSSSYNVDAIPNSTYLQILVTGGPVQDIERTLVTHCQIPANGKRCNLHFDANRLQRHVIERYLAGKAMLTDVESMRTVFPLDILDIPADQHPELERTEGQDQLDFSLQLQLNRLQPEFKRPLQSHCYAQFERALKGETEEHIRELMQLLTQLLENLQRGLRSQPSENQPESYLGAVWTHLLPSKVMPNALAPLKNQRFACIGVVVINVLTKYRAKQWLFAGMPDKYDMAPPESVQSNFSKKVEEILKGTIEVKKRFHAVANAIVGFLKLEKLGLNQEGALKSLFGDYSAVVTDNVTQKDIESLIGNLRVGNYCYLMRQLHTLCGSLLVAIANHASTVPANEYHEPVDNLQVSVLPPPKPVEEEEEKNLPGEITWHGIELPEPPLQSSVTDGALNYIGPPRPAPLPIDKPGVIPPHPVPPIPSPVNNRAQTMLQEMEEIAGNFKQEEGAYHMYLGNMRDNYQAMTKMLSDLQQRITSLERFPERHSLFTEKMQALQYKLEEADSQMQMIDETALEEHKCRLDQIRNEASHKCSEMTNAVLAASGDRTVLILLEKQVQEYLAEAKNLLETAQSFASSQQSAAMEMDTEKSTMEGDLTPINDELDQLILQAQLQQQQEQILYQQQQQQQLLQQQLLQQQLPQQQPPLQATTYATLPDGSRSSNPTGTPGVVPSMSPQQFQNYSGFTPANYPNTSNKLTPGQQLIGLTSSAQQLQQQHRLQQQPQTPPGIPQPMYMNNSGGYPGTITGMPMNPAQGTINQQGYRYQPPTQVQHTPYGTPHYSPMNQQQTTQQQPQFVPQPRGYQQPQNPTTSNAQFPTVYRRM